MSETNLEAQQQDELLDEALSAAFTDLIHKAAQNHITLSACESFTGGLFCSSAASVPGASSVLQGGIVSYQNSVKENLAHVPPVILETWTAVSPQCAMAMAEQTRKQIPSDWCVSFTGNAGPGASEGKPAGELYMALATDDRTIPFCLHADPSMGRNQIRRSAILIMALMLAEAAGNPESAFEEYPAGRLVHLQLSQLQKQ